MRFEKIICEAYGSFTLSADGPMIIRSTVHTKLTPENADAIFLKSGTGSENEAYVIPGSSIKGVVRHFLETNLETPKLLSGIVLKEFFDNYFGSVKTQPPQKSKISFSDAFADMSTVKTSMRYQTKIDAISQGASQGSLNSVLAVTKGDFKCDYHIKNFNIKELELFIKAIKAFDSGELCIGGRISRGYGMVRIKDFSIVISNGFNDNLEPIITNECKSISELENALPEIRKILDKKAEVI